MNKNEKVLLLEITLRDIRSNWGSMLIERLELSKSLAQDLEFNKHIERIERFISNIDKGYADGRDFRCSFEYGGYE